ncbi:MAG: sensor domain-containing protein [Mycobacterium sp.]
MIVVALAVTVGYLLAGRNSQPSTISQPSTTSQPSTRLTPSDAALEGMLLSTDQINTAMGTTGMTVTQTPTAMVDVSADMPDKACLHMASVLEAPVYEGSGWSALRGQGLSDHFYPGNRLRHRVVQAVVLFSSSRDAGAFFTASAQRWPACANRQFTFTMPGQPDAVWSVGPVSNVNGTLSATSTEVSPPPAVPGWACQRALTVINNVAIDINTCTGSVSDSAVDIAHQIAAKVPS